VVGPAKIPANKWSRHFSVAKRPHKIKSWTRDRIVWFLLFYLEIEMKICEKHLKKLGGYYMNTASGSPLTASKDAYRDGWRAALEWVIQDICSDADYPEEIEADIEKELED
jgi:hypothetical protein